MYPMFELLAAEKPQLYERLSQKQYVPFFRNMHDICGSGIFDKTTDITPSEMALCYNIYMHTHQAKETAPTVAETASAMNVSVPAISRTLKNLEAKEYLQRTVNSSDRRIVHISLTEKGEQVLLKNLRIISEIMDRVLTQFSDEELHTMLALHTKFTSAVSCAVSEIKHNL